jgi:hypothetical protein
LVIKLKEELILEAIFLTSGIPLTEFILLSESKFLTPYIAPVTHLFISVSRNLYHYCFKELTGFDFVKNSA